MTIILIRCAAANWSEETLTTDKRVIIYKQENTIIMKLLKIPQMRFVPSKVIAKNKYLLSNSSYGEILIFENNEPKYFVNLFDEKFRDLKDYILSNEKSMEDVLDSILEFAGSKLTTKQNTFGIDLSASEQIEEINIPTLPIEFWENYRFFLHP